MKVRITGQRRLVGLLGTLFALLLASGTRVATAQNALPASHRGFRVSTKMDAGLAIVTFRTPQGVITLALPADTRAGDSIIGSVGWQPTGGNDSIRNSNRTTLDAYTLGLGEQTKTLTEQAPYWKMTVPMVETERWIVLKDGQGVEVAGALLPLAAITSSVQQDEPNRGGAAVRVPNKGQAGRPLALSVGSSGDATNLHVWIGATEAPLLAASPRTILVMTPKALLGKMQLRMKQGDQVVYEGDYRNERIHNNPWPWIIVGVIVGVIAGIAIYRAALAAALQGL